MLQTLLTLFNYGLILLFGVFVTAAFAGIRLDKKNTQTLLLYSCVLILLQLVCYLSYGVSTTEKLYPAISHAPLVLFLCLVYKKNFLTVTVSLMSAYLCCQLSKWIGLWVFYLSDNPWIPECTRALITILLWIFIMRFCAVPISALLSKSVKIVLSFGALPFIYYVFDYCTTVYTHSLYRGSQIAAEFLPFILCAAYLGFCIIYYKEYEEKCENERGRHMAELLAGQYQKDIEAIQYSEYEISRLRHDMHHFLINIKTCIENNAYEKAVASLDELLDDISQTTLQKFCENDLTNIVLSHFQNLMKEKQITFLPSVSLPRELPCSDMDFTSILANGLENAIAAVGPLPPAQRTIALELKMNYGKLLLSIKNPCPAPLKWSGGLPASDREGHGLGTQSIQYVSQKLNGNCQFLEEDGCFILRVII